PFQLQEQKVVKVCLYMALDEIPKEFVSDFTVYFLRDAKERVAEPSDLSEANEVLPKVIKFGLLTDDTLLMLKNAISQKEQPVEYCNIQMRSEIQMSRQKFLSVTQQTTQQTEGNIKLEMPTINLDREVSALATVPEVVEALESYAMTWQKLISTALEEQLKKVPQGDGPLAEINLWRERNDTLSALTEQTKLPEVQKVLAILQEAESEHTGDLQIVLRDLR
ncbi:DYH10 protein, partial [Larus smithsonianus]|nr:DYH10 protein [Larus smithsonianus]